MRSIRLLATLLPSLLPVAAAAATTIPATPLMTVYRFNGDLTVPYYDVDRFLAEGPRRPAGRLTQGSTVIPCLVVRNGRPVTDSNGTPYVGFDVVVDAATATPEASAQLERVRAAREGLRVSDHHCNAGTTRVIDVRRLFDLGKNPRFEPPRRAAPAPPPAASELDAIVRAFHDSVHCAAANRRLTGRRAALLRAWTAFAGDHQGRWPAARIDRARQLDLVLRTALFEGHLDRGCNAYGACERNAIVLSIRNRAVERCLRGQGCRHAGDFEGVATKVSQYNIWDEFLAQTSGLTACFLRSDLRTDPDIARLQAMYAQSRGPAEAILFAGERGLRSVFPDTPQDRLRTLRHYYHPPAMGKCFPAHPRVEYMSGAVARRGNRFALVANTRIHVGSRGDGGYPFRIAAVDARADRDVVAYHDQFPGFVVDARKVTLAKPSRCTPFGTPRSCGHDDAGRFRRTPSWIGAGSPLAVGCSVVAAGETCRDEPVRAAVRVGGACDTEMQTVAGVP